MAKITEIENLYHRLGGYDRIAAIVDELFVELRQDPRFARFAAGRSVDSNQRSRQLMVEQLCSLAGGPCVYIGRDMKTSHAGLGITGAEWDANMEHTKTALQRNGIPAREQDEVLALFNRYREEIVEAGSTTAAPSVRQV